jgi:hypothetical protein
MTIRFASVFGIGIAVGLSGWLWAADDKALRESVLRLADTLEKKDPAANQQADAIAQKLDDLGDLMDVCRMRKKDGKGGLGIGPTPGAIFPDGIEAKLNALSDKAPTGDVLAKEADGLMRMAHVAAAVGLVAERRSKKEGEKGSEDWVRWAQGTSGGSLELAKAISAKDPQQVQQIATKVAANCNDCHKKFRD